MLNSWSIFKFHLLFQKKGFFRWVCLKLGPDQAHMLDLVVVCPQPQSRAAQPPLGFPLATGVCGSTWVGSGRRPAFQGALCPSWCHLACPLPGLPPCFLKVASDPAFGGSTWPPCCVACGASASSPAVTARPPQGSLRRAASPSASDVVLQPVLPFARTASSLRVAKWWFLWSYQFSTSVSQNSPR